MNKRFFLSLVLCLGTTVAFACTNLIVPKGASKDGSVFCTYSADDYGMFQGLTHYPRAKHAAGTMRKIYDWDTNVYHGEIEEAPETYNVVGNINEWQLTIAETTFGGREEMVDTTGILDYGSLIYVTLQRARNAREAIKIMTTLVEKYGYNSEGETFSICDPNEAWIMEMMGCASDRKLSKERTVWVALRIPDDMICGHANQSRISRFNMKDKSGNVLYSKNVVNYARKMGWYSGKDEDFSFCNAYAFPDFSGRRICDARVWSFFNRYAEGMEKYLPWAEGRAADAEPMPLWVKPIRKLGIEDVERAMRDHFEGTPFSLDSDIGGGIWQMPYRPTPLYFKVDGESYFNERPISTQQASFSFVTQMRSWMPREIGGIIWFANDDGNMAPYTPNYCCITSVPRPFHTPGADELNFSFDNAYWVQNWVSNMVYPRYSLMFKTLEQVRDSLDKSYFKLQKEIEDAALAMNEPERVEYLTRYSSDKANEMLASWNKLAIKLIVKYNDMIEKPEKNGVFTRNAQGMGSKVVRPGYPDAYSRELIKMTGNKFKRPNK
ncbi:MAG: C69 family dipeptidase [Prevotella sp.]|nr:C69 family dipeptidase [Prevotella sp.]